MARTKLRVFHVPVTPTASPTQQADILLSVSGDAAKQEARAFLEGSGMVVRSINWAPDPSGSDLLVAYAGTRKKA